MKTRQLLNTVREASTKLYFKAAAAMSVAMGTVASAIIPASAEDKKGSASLSDFGVKEGSASEATSSILDTIITITTFAGLLIGGIMLLVGGIQFGVAFKNEDSEGKTKASHLFVAGIILMAIGGIMGTLVRSLLIG
jgi:hypothetical protein